MTEKQRDAFFAATNGIAAIDLLVSIAMIVLTFYTLWVVWLTLGQARGWWSDQVELYDLIWTILRAAILLLLVGYFTRP